MTYTTGKMRGPHVASYTEYQHGRRYLHIKGPAKEAGELVRIAMSVPGREVIERVEHPATGQVETIIELER